MTGVTAASDTVTASQPEQAAHHPWNKPETSQNTDIASAR